MHITYVKFGLVAAGLLCSAMSGCHLMVNANVEQTPFGLDLAAMERGEAPASRYVRLDAYVVRADETFFEEQVTPKKGGGEVRIRDFYFPVVSASNPAADPLKPLE